MTSVAYADVMDGSPEVVPQRRSITRRHGLLFVAVAVSRPGPFGRLLPLGKEFWMLSRMLSLTLHAGFRNKSACLSKLLCFKEDTPLGCSGQAPCQNIEEYSLSG
jgi:hypothetical protein